MRALGTLHRSAFLPAIATLIVFAHPLRAEITWPAKTIELQADAKANVLEARFAFVNAGETAVEITQVESSCGCTVATVEKRRYEPHENGEIVARYTVGAQTGLQTKTLLVATNDGREPTALTLKIFVPEFVRLQPGLLAWKHDESPTPKSFSLEIVAATPADEVSVASSATGFQADLKTLAPGRKYELNVHPLATAQPGLTTLAIRCRFGHEEKIVYAYASVRAAETKD